MTDFHVEGLEADTIQDFIAEYDELYQAAEKTILELENQPEDVELLNALFRAIHTIKGNCGYLGIQPLIELLQELESILHIIRTGDMAFGPLVGDITLLMMDRCTVFLHEMQQNFTVDYNGEEFKLLEAQLKHACDGSPGERYLFLSKVLSTLDPNTVASDLPSEPTEHSSLLPEVLSDDLKFIYEAATTTQSRTSFWLNRLDRVIGLLVRLNNTLDNRLDTEQLIAAACIHDLSMAFFPSQLLNKQTPLTQQEKNQLREHVPLAVRMAINFQHWDVARQILEDHHEHLDGSGYPYGKRGSEVFIGAQMLAIVHAYEAITHGYSRDVSLKRPMMRAIMELNRCIDNQFNRTLVEAFMKVLST
jgi:HD-GYP domain-containing protein (c-di-GMP phosphodiesterase class II)